MLSEFWSVYMYWVSFMAIPILIIYGFTLFLRKKNRSQENGNSSVESNKLNLPAFVILSLTALAAPVYGFFNPSTETVIKEPIPEKTKHSSSKAELDQEKALAHKGIN